VPTAQAIEELLAYDFSPLSDIVEKRQSDLPDLPQTAAKPARDPAVRPSGPPS
jgi:hypothetical protein